MVIKDMYYSADELIERTNKIFIINWRIIMLLYFRNAHMVIKDMCYSEDESIIYKRTYQIFIILSSYVIFWILLFSKKQ